MSAPEPNVLEASIVAILDTHFENCENPHETIYRIWLLLQPGDREIEAAGTIQGRDRLH